MPRVSVVVPVHNTEQYLRDCVASIQSQTLEDIEIILVENASTDGSLALCNQLAAGDSRIKVISLEIGDLPTARNEGVKVAEGEFVGFVDSDDTIAHDMFESLYSLAEENDLDLVSSNYFRRYDDKPDRYSYPEDGKVRLLSPKEFLKLNYNEKVPVNACMMLFRKSLFDKVQFPVNRYFEDRASTYKFIAASRKAAHVNKSYYCYYQRSSGICRSKPSWKKYRDWVLADSERLDYLGKSEYFTAEEKRAMASRPADTCIRKMRRLYNLSKTPEQMEETKALLESMNELIPSGCSLSLKARLIRFWLNTKRL